ncbi:hypothetical protein DPMN_121387 [Dreissena polymorpha]|uniref:Uncharacterized protein n=1 Tax=Dreissena polymorpha TaxID=45954 RepID=A0A9D4GTG2_DREPO|nr:hypothetical protein DPMN_121387 [Dreissena polymorpha]
MLCTRHLKENPNRYMEDEVGYPISDRKEINELVFGENGLIKAVDMDTYNVRLDRIKRLITSKDENVRGKQFLPYFVNKLVPTLNDFVIKPSLIGMVSTGWTNNNCESANHIKNGDAMEVDGPQQIHVKGRADR